MATNSVGLTLGLEGTVYSRVLRVCQLMPIWENAYVICLLMLVFLVVVCVRHICTYLHLILKFSSWYMLVVREKSTNRFQ
jgi:hypothetical protein